MYCIRAEAYERFLFGNIHNSISHNRRARYSMEHIYHNGYRQRESEAEVLRMFRAHRKRNLRQDILQGSDEPVSPWEHDDDLEPQEPEEPEWKEDEWEF